MTVTESRRGPYAKGVERRAQILEAAMSVYTVSSSPSLRVIAESVGLSEAGVLHYFGSREELFVAILQARDAAAASAFDFTTLDGVWAALDHASHTPGLSKLYVDMSVAAADPAHPARAFMEQRHARLIAGLSLYIRGAAPDDWRARALVAAAEGLQIQWLRDPTIDIVATMKQLAALVIP